MIYFVVCNYIMTVRNIFVLLAYDYGRSVRDDDTLNLCGCYHRNLSIYAFITVFETIEYVNVWLV
ncbi:unnamed protein product, partial [Urochloa humidicola]